MRKKIMCSILAIISALNISACSKNNNVKDTTIAEDNTQVSENTNNFYKPRDDIKEIQISNTDNESTETEEIEPVIQDITISAAGDCTLGYDDNFGYTNSLPYVLEQNDNDYSYFFKGVYDIFNNDDITIVNLEGTFTDATKKKEKTFNFKGPKDYTNILLDGSVESVNVANNHTMDYLEKGYNDTLESLENADIDYFGYQKYSILDVDGIKIGLAGFPGWSESEAKNSTLKAIEYFNENETDLIIISYHWGVEREYKQNSTQENIARYAIDNGADLVLGHHPHVLQGIEEYNGKYIVYSLGNFVFGGNKNPKDKDTMIFRETFHFIDGVLNSTDIEIIPVRLSSVIDKNDYQPTILDGEEKTRVLKKIKDNSTNFDY